MTRRTGPTIRVLFMGLLAFCFLPNAQFRYVNATTLVTYDCEGDACSAVSLTWDQDRQQFRVQNDSDRAVKVEVSTFAGSSYLSVPPHKAEYLEVKTFNGPYQANYE